MLAGCGRAAEVAPPEAPISDAAARSAEPESGPVAQQETVTTELSLLSEVSHRNSSARSLAFGKDAPPPLGAKPPASAPAETAEPARQEPTPASGRNPLLIYTATVTMAVFGLDTALDSVEELARARHGYLVRRADASITVRVPAAVFQETLAGVGKLGDELHREVTGRDVTEEYADLEIRLRNAEVVRQRLETLLAKANVEEALSVERELARVTGTIEELKGKLKLMSELVAFSTITVNFQARSVEHLNAERPLPFDWLKELGLSNLLAL